MLKKFFFGALFDKQFQAQLCAAASIFFPHIGRCLSPYSLFLCTNLGVHLKWLVSEKHTLVGCS